MNFSKIYIIFIHVCLCVCDVICGFGPKCHWCSQWRNWRSQGKDLPKQNKKVLEKNTFLGKKKKFCQKTKVSKNVNKKKSFGKTLKTFRQKRKKLKSFVESMINTNFISIYCGIKSS